MGTEDGRFVRVESGTPASDEMLSLTGHDVKDIMLFLAHLKTEMAEGSSAAGIANDMSRTSVGLLDTALRIAGGDALDPGDKLMLLCGMCASAMMSIHANMRSIGLQLDLDGGGGDVIERLITPPRER